MANQAAPNKAGGPQAALLPDGRRLHLNHGPIDLVIEGFGDPADVRAAYARATAYFAGVLDGLVGELPILRRPIDPATPEPEGAVARRMVAACRPYSGVFVTPMAAVAGAVADAVMAAMLKGGDLARAYVNNGGDIALHLAPGSRFETGLVTTVGRPERAGVITVTATMPVRGIATSGRGGRSLGLGIADAVTVLARNAAAADVAATLIANAVDLDHPAIERLPARDLDPDSDLGERLVTVAVGRLDQDAISAALAAGAARAERLRGDGLIHGAVLVLARRRRLVGDVPTALASSGDEGSRPS